MDAAQTWYGVRTVIDHGPRHDSNAEHVYEERIILVKARSFDDAIA
jgi:hypothetical protein